MGVNAVSGISKRISSFSLAVLLLATVPAGAFTIERYRLGMTKKEAASVGLTNCEFVQPKNVYRCSGISNLKNVHDVEITIGVNGNEVVEINYWVYREQQRYAKVTEVVEYLGLAPCALKDTSILFSGISLSGHEHELCLGGADRIRNINAAETSRSKYGGNFSPSHGFWVITASYSPETNRLQRKDIDKKLEASRRTKAFNDSLR